MNRKGGANMTVYPATSDPSAIAKKAKLQKAIKEEQKQIADEENDRRDDDVGEEGEGDGGDQNGDDEGNQQEEIGEEQEEEHSAYPESDADGEALIGHNQNDRPGTEHEALRKALKKPHEESGQHVHMVLEGSFTLEQLMSGHHAIPISNKIAQNFQRRVVDPKTGDELLIGDISRCQVTEILVLGHHTELPINIGVESPQLPTEKNAAKKVVATNGRSYPYIAKKESCVDYTLSSNPCLHKGHLLYQNLSILPKDLFEEWGGVTVADLTTGITPISGTNESLLDMDKNKRIVDILYNNQELFQRDFSKFSYKELVRDVKKGRRMLRIWNEVLQKAVDLGVQMAVKPVTQGTMDIRNLSIGLYSTTSEDGKFGDLQKFIAHRYGADQVADIMKRVYPVTFDLVVKAHVANTHYAGLVADVSSKGASSATDDSVEGDDQ